MKNSMKNSVKNSVKINFVGMALLLLSFSACEQQNPVEPNPYQTGDTMDSPRGMLVLNEGGFGANNASLDYLDFRTGVYDLNKFTQVNPTLTQGLGDVGNDVCVYGGKAYVCVNGSGLIEVVDAASAKHLNAIQLANCRRLYAYDGYVYVSSYAGRVIDANHQVGQIVKIDTTSLAIVATCEVGYQPEGMAVVNGKLYVANSGGYVGMNTTEGYDQRLSVINLASFTLDKHIDIAPNLQEVFSDSHGCLWISSYGNYADVASNLYRFDPATETFMAMNTAVTKMTMVDDVIYFLTTTYDESWNAVTSFYTLAVASEQIAPLALDTPVSNAYAIAVNPVNKDIYVTDAGDYVNPGKVYCFTSNGSLKWSLYAGVVPGHFAFVY